jgi:hypothetical protein
MIEALRSLNEQACGSHYGTAVTVPAVAVGLMARAVIWLANLIAYKRDLFRFFSITRFSSMG